MKVIKPLKLAILHRTFQENGGFRLAVTVAVFFPFDQPDRILPEIAMWKCAAAELNKDFALDMGMPKGRGEILVKGKCFADRNSPRAGKEVRLTSGTIDKRLWVFGDRRWVNGAAGARPGDAAPFTEMAVSWTNAFGGPEYPQNPVGKGFAPIQSRNGETIHLLPNVEDPGALIMQPGHRVRPAGFEPYDATWPQRVSKIGTYDDTWLHERFPGYAADMDWSYFNTAPADQQLDGYFKDGQEFEIAGMHPSKPAVRSRVPGILIRCFLNQKRTKQEQFRELKSVADTLWLFPHIERGILLFRAVAEIATDDAFDLLQLVVGAESPAAPRTADHYREVLNTRLDREKGFRSLLRDDQLMPPPVPAAKLLPEEHDEMGPLVTPSGIARKRMRAQAEKRLALTKEGARAQRETLIKRSQELGLPLPDLSELDRMMAQELPAEKEIKSLADIDFDEIDRQMDEGQQRLKAMEADILAKKEQAQNQAREQLKRQGLDYDAIVAERAQQAGPPRFDAKAELARLKASREQMLAQGITNPELDRMLADPDLEKRLREMEDGLDQMYRKYAHHLPETAPMPAAEAKRLRAEVLAGYQRGEKFASKNLAGADLSGLNLKHIDFSGAVLEGVNLSDADLSGADLKGAVLARAKLLKTRLVKSNLAGANLGKCNLEQADLSDANLSGATLSEASLISTNLAKANLEGADVMGAKLAGVNLSGALFPELRLMNADLTGANCSEARMKRALFYQCKMEEVDFRKADLEGAALISVRGDRINFTGANLQNLRTGMETSMIGVTLAGAILKEANLRQINLDGSNLAGAQIDGADFSQASLRKADLRQASGRGVRMVRTDLSDARLDDADLLEAVLQKATLAGATLTKANLYRADTLRVTVDQKTRLDGANVDRTLLKEWKK